MKIRKIDRGTQRQGQTGRDTLRGQHWVQTFIEMIKALEKIEKDKENQREADRETLSTQPCLKTFIQIIQAKDRERVRDRETRRGIE